MDQDPPIDEHREGMFFEMAKHFTTLNSAAILVFLAVGRESDLPRWIIFLFVISLVGATLSMISTGTGKISTRPRQWGNFSLTIAVICFFAGVLESILNALF